jgi:hypothetical protein
MPAPAVVALVDELTSGATSGRRELNFTAMGGAYNRVPEDATAFVHRGERFLLEHVAHGGDPWLDRSWALARPRFAPRLPQLPRPRPRRLVERLPRRERRAAPGGQATLRPRAALPLPTGDLTAGVVFCAAGPPPPEVVPVHRTSKRNAAAPRSGTRRRCAGDRRERTALRAAPGITPRRRARRRRRKGHEQPRRGACRR